MLLGVRENPGRYANLDYDNNDNNDNDNNDDDNADAATALKSNNGLPRRSSSPYTGIDYSQASRSRVDFLAMRQFFGYHIRECCFAY